MREVHDLPSTWRSRRLERPALVTMQCTWGQRLMARPPSGLSAEIDRSDRHDLSLFRLGWDFLERRLALFDPIPSVSLPNLCLVSGG
jgi:hypothetical protein